MTVPTFGPYLPTQIQSLAVPNVAAPQAPATSRSSRSLGRLPPARIWSVNFGTAHRHVHLLCRAATHVSLVTMKRTDHICRFVVCVVIVEQNQSSRAYSRLAMDGTRALATLLRVQDGWMHCGNAGHVLLVVSPWYNEVTVDSKHHKIWASKVVYS